MNNLTESMIYGLCNDEKYFLQVIPYLKPEMFQLEGLTSEEIIVEKMIDYHHDYLAKPSIEDIMISLAGDTKTSEDLTNQARKFIERLLQFKLQINYDNLLNQTSQWVKDRAIEIAINNSMNILRNDKNREEIQKQIEDALSINFNAELGHDYYKDTPKRYEWYTTVGKGFKCNIGAINQAVGGEFYSKSIYVFNGRTNIGKTLWMCHLAGDFVREGYKVLYVSAEMSEEMIGKRIDANMLDIPMNDFNKSLDRSMYFNKVKGLIKSLENGGRLKIKEYPTGAAHAGHLKTLLKEYRMKDRWVPDIIVLDYLNIFASNRLPASKAADKYTYVKSVIEEMRGLCVTEDICLITATQFNRGGGKKEASDVDLEDTADSWGIPMTADWSGGIIQSPELLEQGKYILKVLKTRFDENNNKTYMVGVERSKMRLTNLSSGDDQMPVGIQVKMEMADAMLANKALDEDLFQ